MQQVAGQEERWLFDEFAVYIRLGNMLFRSTVEAQLSFLK